MDGTILAAAGLRRLGLKIDSDGIICRRRNSARLACHSSFTRRNVPCVGQAAIGIEVRENDSRIDAVMEKLNHSATWHCVTAERAFLRAMGGGCQSAVGAHAEIVENQIRLRAVSYLGKAVQRGELQKPLQQAVELGEELAESLISK